jgi:hypothetical protein
MQIGNTVFNNELGKGTIIKISPSKTLVCVNFEKVGTRVVPRLSIRLVYNEE